MKMPKPAALAAINGQPVQRYQRYIPAYAPSATLFIPARRKYWTPWEGLKGSRNDSKDLPQKQKGQNKFIC